MMQRLNRKNSFEDYGAEPSPLVWEKIEKQLPAPPGKKRGWLIWSAAAVLIGGMLFSIYWFDIEITLKKKGTAEKPVASSTNETQSSAAQSSSQKNQLQVTQHEEKNNNVAEKEKSSSENIVLLPGRIKTKLKKHTALPEEQTLASVQEKAIEGNETVPVEEAAVAVNEGTKD